MVLATQPYALLGGHVLPEVSLEMPSATRKSWALLTAVLWGAKDEALSTGREMEKCMVHFPELWDLHLGLGSDI